MISSNLFFNQKFCYLTQATKALLCLLLFIQYCCLADKPKILIARPLVRSAPQHFVWCSAEGYPPINISIIKNSTSLAKGTGLVIARLNETGNYSCVASNEAGTDTKYFLVTILGKIYSSVGTANEILWFLKAIIIIFAT